MSEYTAKWRRINKLGFGLWKTEKKLIGHRWYPEQFKMIFYYSNGSVKEIAQWHMCEISLDTDWVLFEKAQLEKKAGQPVQLAVNVKE